jgi:hypothetical protein
MLQFVIELDGRESVIVFNHVDIIEYGRIFLFRPHLVIITFYDSRCIRTCSNVTRFYISQSQFPIYEININVLLNNGGVYMIGDFSIRKASTCHQLSNDSGLDLLRPKE